MTHGRPTELRVAIAGLGAIGSTLAAELDRGIDGLVLAAVALRDPAKHRAFLDGLRRPPVVVRRAAQVNIADRQVNVVR